MHRSACYLHHAGLSGFECCINRHVSFRKCKWSSTTPSSYATASSACLIWCSVARKSKLLILAATKAQSTACYSCALERRDGSIVRSASSGVLRKPDTLRSFALLFSSWDMRRGGVQVWFAGLLAKYLGLISKYVNATPPAFWSRPPKSCPTPFECCKARLFSGVSNPVWSTGAEIFASRTRRSRSTAPRSARIPLPEATRRDSSSLLDKVGARATIIASLVACTAYCEPDFGS